MKKVIECIVCKSKKFTFQYLSKDRMFNLSGEFSVKKCPNCSLVFLDPQPVGSQLKKYYPSKKYYAYSKDDIKDLFEILREYLAKNYYSPTFLSKISTF